VDLERVVEVEEVLHLVVGDGAVNHCLLAGPDDNEGELDGGVGSGRSCHFLHFSVPLYQVLLPSLLKTRAGEEKDLFK